jgi:PKD repeat protein
MRLIGFGMLLFVLTTVSGCALLEGTKLAPVAIIEVIPQQGAIPFEVTFSGVGSSDIYTAVESYSWDLGDGTTDDEAIVSHTYRQTGVYVVTLTVTNGFGLENTEKATVVVTREPGPEAPRGLSTDAVSSRSIELKWLDGSSDEDGFQVERRGPEGSFTPIATMMADEVEFTDNSSLEPDTRYCYRVRAFNRAGNSDYSNESCDNTPVSSGPIGDVVSTDENSLVSITRTITDNDGTLTVDVLVEAKVELELLAVVETLDSLELVSGELTSFTTNLQPGDTFGYSYTISDDSAEDGGTVSGTVRAKPVDEDSQTLQLISQLQR